MVHQSIVGFVGSGVNLGVCEIHPLDSAHSFLLPPSSVTSHHARRANHPQSLPQGPSLQPAGRPTTGLRQTRSNPCVFQNPVIMSNLHSVFASHSSYISKCNLPRARETSAGRECSHHTRNFPQRHGDGSGSPLLGLAPAYLVQSPQVCQ